MRVHGKRATTGPVAALVWLALLAGSAACTGRAGPDREPEGPGAVAPRSAPLQVVVTRVAGRLGPEPRRALEASVAVVLSRYLDAAFLAGRYPRSDFSRALAAFSPSVVPLARRDQDLLTNRPLGATTESVRATRRTAYLSVLAPGRVPAGVTARVDLAFVVDRGDRPAERVRLRGRLLLTPHGSRGWSIFGYDLNRADTPVPVEAGAS